MASPGKPKFSMFEFFCALVVLAAILTGCPMMSVDNPEGSTVAELEQDSGIEGQ